MSTNAASAQDGKAVTIRETFSRETSVSIRIAADAEIVWKLLTNAEDFSRWNSTIISIGGTIKVGEKIKLKAKIAEDRTFKIKVKEYQTNERMVWGDGKGQRVFTTTKNIDGSLTFKMHEKMGGLMFPMYAKHIPSFDEPFEAFAADLKKEAELIQDTKN